ncbi:hypothetical protein [Ruminobacter sp. RM87]|uniref:hypothetical protein n=1 Tax=Ruminobacter sp. RM87 TaxID=1200567 RepID=UPI0004E0F18D|nr:hypothetical protein [Ruminobacter sp. RM87]
MLNTYTSLIEHTSDTNSEDYLPEKSDRIFRVLFCMRSCLCSADHFSEHEIRKYLSAVMNFVEKENPDYEAEMLIKKYIVEIQKKYGEYDLIQEDEFFRIKATFKVDDSHKENQKMFDDIDEVLNKNDLEKYKIADIGYGGNSKYHIIKTGAVRRILIVRLCWWFLRIITRPFRKKRKSFR